MVNLICKPALVVIMFAYLGVSRARIDAAPIQWTVASGGNGHYYERIDQTNLTFEQAEADASALTFNSQPGHLVILDTSDYSAERDFVFQNVYSPAVTSSEVYWLGAFLPAGNSTWSWVDGSTVPSSISNGWDVDHNEGPGDEGGCFFNTSSNTVWDYIASNSSHFVGGYLVEFEPDILGDFNRDGHVDAADISIAEQALTNSSSYRSTYGLTDPTIFNSVVDVNGDGSFTNADLQKLLIILKSGGGSMDPVPEPSTLALLGLGSLGLLVRRKFDFKS
jgi:hypothetical protein